METQHCRLTLVLVDGDGTHHVWNIKEDSPDSFDRWRSKAWQASMAGFFKEHGLELIALHMNENNAVDLFQEHYDNQSSRGIQGSHGVVTPLRVVPILKAV